LLGVSVRAVDYLIARGELRTRRLGGRVLVPHADLVKFASRDHSSPIVSTTQEVAA
jgi:excisionase family DNA binding protein